MKTFFDASVLVAAAVDAHVHHEPSRAAIVHAAPGATSAHCLAEIYSTLTGRGGPYRLAPHQALPSIESIAARMEIVALGTREYSRALERAAALGLVGPVVYDFLIAAAAERAAAGRLYTWNTRHFAAFAASLRLPVTTPAPA